MNIMKIKMILFFIVVSIVASCKKEDTPPINNSTNNVDTIPNKGEIIVSIHGINGIDTTITFNDCHLYLDSMKVNNIMVRNLFISIAAKNVVLPINSNVFYISYFYPSYVNLEPNFFYYYIAGKNDINSGTHQLLLKTSFDYKTDFGTMTEISFEGISKDKISGSFYGDVTRYASGSNYKHKMSATFSFSGKNIHKSI